MTRISGTENFDLLLYLHQFHNFFFFLNIQILAGEHNDSSLKNQLFNTSPCQKNCSLKEINVFFCTNNALKL